MGAMEIINGVTVYTSEPQTESRGTVIVIHEIWGLVDHIKDVADRYAAEGYLAIAPDILSDIGVTPEVGNELFDLRNEPDEAKRIEGQALMREKTAPIRLPEFAGPAIEKLKRVVDGVEAESNGRIAVTGFCFGGAYAYALAANDPRITAAIPFYGTAPSIEDIAKIQCPVLALYGEDDPAIMEKLPQVRETMEKAGVDFEMQIYPGARHAFFNDTSPSAYDAEAAADAWRRSLAHLERSFAAVTV